MEPTIVDKLEKSPEEMPVTSPTPAKKENKNLSAAVWLPLLILFVLPVGAFLYFYLSGKIVFVDEKNTENQQEEENNQEIAEEEESENTDENESSWTGTYLKGDLPKGWNFEEKDFELGGKDLIFRNNENTEQEYYLAPWYHSTCVKADNVQQLFEISFLDNTAYLMTADCEDTDNTIIGRKVYMEYPSTEEVRNLGTVAENGIRETTQYVFDTLNSEDESKTIDDLRAEYAPIKLILESIEVVEQEENDEVSTEGWKTYTNSDLGFSIKFNGDGDATLSYDNSSDTDAEEYVAEKEYRWKRGNIEDGAIQYWENANDRSVEEFLDIIRGTEHAEYEKQNINGIDVYRGYNNNLPQAHDSVSYIFENPEGKIIEILYYVDGMYGDTAMIDASINSLTMLD